MPRTLLVWWTETAQENIDHGLLTRTWGLREDPRNRGDGGVDYILFGRSFRAANGGASPRVPAATWANGACDITVAQATCGLYPGHAPHWPDESPTSILYPVRLGFLPLGRVAGVTLDGTGPLAAGVAEALRGVASSSRSIIVDCDVRPLLRSTGVQIDANTQEPNLGTTLTPEPIPRRRGNGAGRTNDPRFRAAVELHAVDMATAHMQTLGWTEIEPLGKPFDLVCRRPSGEEKHVEVKGTSGSGAEVEYTANEVDHFRTCPHGADLIVVRDISVNRTTYECQGGQLLHTQSYVAPPEDLQPTRWRARVNGWED